VEHYQIVAPLENKGGEAVKYTKVVHFSELIHTIAIKYLSELS
jgi:hypothetical protein